MGKIFWSEDFLFGIVHVIFQWHFLEFGKCKAGQHWFEALTQVMLDSEERWRPVRIYLSPLSEKSLNRVRENVTEVQLDFSDGEQFVHFEE